MEQVGNKILVHRYTLSQLYYLCVAILCIMLQIWAKNKKTKKNSEEGVRVVEADVPSTVVEAESVRGS